MADASTTRAPLEFEGFANTRDEDGNVVDAREVDRFVDESDEGQIREKSQTTESSLVQFRTEGTGTNGPPAAVVGKTPTETATGSASPSTEDTDAETDGEPEIEQRNDAPEDPDSDDPKVASEDEVAAGGRGAKQA